MWFGRCEFCFQILPITMEVDADMDMDESWESSDDDAQIEAIKKNPKYMGSFFDAHRFNPVYLNDCALKWVKVPNDTDEPIAEWSVVSPSNFYVQLEYTQHQLKSLNEKLNEYCNEVESVQYIYNLKELCLVHFREQWRRVVVIERTMVEEKRQYKVHFLDYGFASIVSDSNMRPMMRAFLNPPFQACRCGVQGITPVNGSWSEEALEYFRKDIMQSNLVKSVKKVKESDDGRCLVKLEIENPGAVKCADVSELLIERGYAKAV